MEEHEFEKSKPIDVAASVDYVTGSIKSRVILKRSTGSIAVVSFDATGNQPGATSAFDNFIMAIDGNAVITIDDRSFAISPGCSLIIPAHARRSFQTTEKFKMLITVIKSGYEG